MCIKKSIRIIVALALVICLMMEILPNRVKAESVFQSADEISPDEIDNLIENGVDVDSSLTDSQKEAYYLSKIQEGTKSGGSPDNTNEDGLVTYPLIYLKNKYGTQYTYSTQTKLLSSVPNRVMSDYGTGNICSLAAMATVMGYYRYVGYTRITGNYTNWYSVVYNEALCLGFNSTDGLSVTKIDNLAADVWTWGYGYASGTGDNYYTIYGTTENHIISELNNNRPVLISLASGVYYNHTVVVCGYRRYTNNTTGSVHTFLILRDGWSTSTRYLAWTNTGSNYTFCTTTVTPPSSYTD